MKPCPYCVAAPLLPRPANALCVEIAAPAPRCKLRVPPEWLGREPASGPSLADRWLRSGGCPFVFGVCTPGACAITRP